MAAPASTSMSRNRLSNLQDTSSAQRVHLERLRPRPRVISLSRRPRRAKYPRQNGQTYPRSHQLSTNTASLPGDYVRPVRTAIRSTSRKAHERKSLEPSEVISKLDLSDYHSTGRHTPANRMPLPRCIPEPFAVSGTERHDRTTSVDEISGHTKAISTPTLNHLPSSTNVDSRAYPTNFEAYSSNDTERSTSKMKPCTSSLPRRREVDDLLVEAIARSVAQQFRLLSIGSRQRSDEQDNQHLEKQPADSSGSSSMTSSQRAAFDHFIQELQRCAENAGTKDNIPPITPTPTWSDATVRTISALLPYRSEFTAAGLAVTSNDQAKRNFQHPRAGVIRRTRTPFPRSSVTGAQLGQLDGNDGNSSSSREVPSAVPNSMSGWKYAAEHEATSHRQQNSSRNSVAEAQCLPCVPKQTNRSDIWGCLQLMQKSEPRLLTSKPTTKGQDFGTYFESTMPKLPAKSSAPQWANLTPPHIMYPPQHQQDTGIRNKQTLCQTGQVQLGKKSSFPVFSSGPRMSVSLSHLQDQIELPREGQNSGPHESHHMTEESSPAKPDGGLGKRLRLIYSSEELSQQQRQIDIPPKRYQSVPTHDISKDARSIIADMKPLSNMTWAPKDMIDDGSNVDCIMELANKSSVKDESCKEVTKSLSRKHSSFFELPGSPQNITLCSRGHPNNDLARPNIPQRMSSIPGNARVTNKDSGEGEIIDRDVLRGLHIATSAACDEKIDAFICAKTGLRIRRFLADLMLFENLGDDADEQWVEKRAGMRNAKRRARRAQRAKKVGLVSH